MSDSKINLPPIFVISLKRSQDRRKSISSQFNSLGIPFQFFDAIDGRQLSEGDLKSVNFQKAKELCGHDLSLGEVGCSLSHIKLYEKCLEENIDEVIILEDDIMLKKDFLTVLTECFKKKLSSCEILYLFHGKAKTSFFYTKLYNEYKLRKVRSPSSHSKRFITGTVGYYVNKKAMRTLLDIAYPVRMPADYLTGFIQKSKLRCYFIEPNLIDLAGFDTTINDRNYGDHIQVEDSHNV